MNPHNVHYLAKILCLKAEVARDPYVVVSRDLLRRYDVRAEYGDLVTRVTVTHKIESAVTVFQVFNETAVAYTPVEHDYGEPIIVTAFAHPAHNKIPVSFLYIDLLASDLFPRFARVDPDTAKVITSLLTPEDRRAEPPVRLPRMLETEVVAKILFHREVPLKIVRFFKPNMVTGVEIVDRAVAAVLE
ncbi:DNA-dependent RNA polymerase 22 kDa subunit [Equine molluscum contagiosum-like virus]|nr:DNA-dependent RNA polymerase 22 kDa subunit [Equine molluscum contagiosum-like virus]